MQTICGLIINYLTNMCADVQVRAEPQFDCLVIALQGGGSIGALACDGSAAVWDGPLSHRLGGRVLFFSAQCHV